MKRFTVPIHSLSADGEKDFPFHIYSGVPHPFTHPLYYQQRWLQNFRGFSIGKDVLDSFSKLNDIANKNRCNFEELCVYALGPQATAVAADPNAHPRGTTQPQAHWCGKKCENVEELCAIAAQFSDHLFGSFSQAELAEDESKLHYQDHAKNYFYAVMVLWGIGSKKGHPPHYFNLETKISEVDCYPFEHASYNVAVSLDTQGRFIPMHVMALLDFFLGYRANDKIILKTIAIIQRKFSAIAKKGTIAVPNMSKQNCEAFVKLCQGWQAAQPEKPIKPAEKKKRKQAASPKKQLKHRRTK